MDGPDVVAKAVAGGNGGADGGGGEDELGMGMLDLGPVVMGIRDGWMFITTYKGDTQEEIVDA